MAAYSPVEEHNCTKSNIADEYNRLQSYIMLKENKNIYKNDGEYL